MNIKCIFMNERVWIADIEIIHPNKVKINSMVFDSISQYTREFRKEKHAKGIINEDGKVIELVIHDKFSTLYIVTNPNNISNYERATI